MAGHTVGSRVLWADSAKGLAVLAVVFVHVSTKHVLTGAWQVSSLAETLLEAFVSGLAPVRMPLFFIISGLFAARAILRPWPSMLRNKVWFFYYLYLTWLLVQSAVYLATPHFKTAIPHTVLDIVAQATFMPSALWYLYALALYFPMAKLLSKSPRTGLVLALLVSFASITELVPEWGNLQAVGQHFVWFAFGAIYPQVVMEFSQRARGWWLVVLIPLFIAPMGVLFKLNAKEPFLLTFAGVAGVAVAIVLVVLFADRFPAVAERPALIGQRTLPIYVLHMPLLALWDFGVSALPLSIVPSNPVAVIGYAVAVSAVIVWFALLLNRLLKPAAPVLFTAPGSKLRPVRRSAAHKQLEIR